MGTTQGPEGVLEISEVRSTAEHALEAIDSAANLEDIARIRAAYLGRGDGHLTVFRKQLGSIPDPLTRREVGSEVNQLWEKISEALDARQGSLEAVARQEQLRSEVIDLTRPAPPLARGHLHPATKIFREVRRIFAQLGYNTVTGPEVEYDLYNFTLVNMPPGHPSRDTQATFFIDDWRVLRTHTSPVQIRSMIQHGAPQRVIVPGKVYRRDYDATHFPMFHQVEGLCIDEGISVSDLKGTLEYFVRSLFGSERGIRIRPHHFAFTEPSLEVDVSCMVCGGDGCKLCKFSGWLEVLGSGMVHPNVLRNGGIDPERYSGFAFGVGVDRLAQLLYNIEDGRLVFENDVRYLRQG